jgi:hypothetical protein
MNRLYLAGTLLVTLAVLFSACSPAPQAFAPIVSTAVAGTAEPFLLTELPPNYTPPPTTVPPTPTPIPTLPGGLGPTELKYRLLAEFPDFFFCDPDYYPVARADELELALQHFPELEANPEEFTTILEHNGLAGLSTYTDEQKLLIYQEHKKLAAIPFELNQGGYAFQIQVAKTEGRGELVSGTIDSQGKINIQERTPSIATCPICLAAGSLIDTPTGPILVEDLRLGTLVWTLDTAGKRVAQPLLRLGKTVVPSSHRVVHLVLDDGRQLWVSPGHPTADGRRVGQLRPGDAPSGVLDGAQVRSAEWVLDPSAATYDLLPAGDTGFYWANGILLASSLKD